MDLKPNGPASGNRWYLLLYHRCCRENTTLVPVSPRELSTLPYRTNFPLMNHQPMARKDSFILVMFHRQANLNC